jgi:effector-binding domain-containing protein
MKYLLAIVILLVFVVFSFAYLYVPNTIKVSGIASLRALSPGVNRFITNKNVFNNWLASTPQNNFSFEVTTTLSNITALSAHNAQTSIKTHLMSIGLSADSSALQWSAEIEAGKMPVQRIRRYFNAVVLKKSIDTMLSKLQQFMSNTGNLYGIPVSEIRLKDSLFATTKIQTLGYPSTAIIYKGITSLTNYAVAQKAKITDAPMLHVQQTDSTHYEAFIGLPLNKRVPSTKEIKVKEMPYGGSMFVTELRGGPQKIALALHNLSLYQKDSGRPSPAIPFEILITDRLTETDTSRWITRIYYPVM